MLKVFEPINIGRVKVPNRIVRTAHDTGLAYLDISDDYIAYHLARAKGGCGLSILEASSVHPSSQIHVALWRDSIVPGFEKLMKAVRPYGMKVFQQLWHGGNIAAASGWAGAVSCPLTGRFAVWTRRAPRDGGSGVRYHRQIPGAGSHGVSDDARLLRYVRDERIEHDAARSFFLARPFPA